MRMISWLSVAWGLAIAGAWLESAVADVQQPGKAGAPITWELVPATSFSVDVSEQPAQLAAASDNALYLVDMMSSRVLAYAPDGQLLWHRDFSTLGASRSIQGITVDAQDRVFVLDARQRVVHRLNRVGDLEGPVRLDGVEASVRPFRPLAPDAAGGFYLLAGRDKRRVHHFDGEGRRRELFAVPADLQEESPIDAGGLSVGPDGRLLVRPAGRLTLERFTRTGGYVGSLALTAPPLARPNATIPGDDIWAGDVLADGRFVCEVVHRTPLQRDGVPAVSVRTRVYVFGAGGALQAVATPGRLGTFVAAAPGGRLYFTTTVRGATAGAPGRAHSVILH